MRLTSFQVREYQSVWDSGEIEIGDVTCLVGKNESGKTALLQALYKINPIIENDANFDVTDEYPRKEVGDYQHHVEVGDRKHATVIETTFKLEEPDINAVAAVFGKNVLRSRGLTLVRGYSNKNTFTLDFDEGAARVHLIDSASLVDPLQKQLRGVGDWAAFSQVLESAETTEAVTYLKELVAKFKDHSAQSYAYNSILKLRLPKLLYFDEYYQMEGHENVNALIARNDANDLKRSDYPLLGLVNIARLKLTDLLNTQRTLELTNTLEGAGNHLTRQILQYWSQNRHLQMKFDVREARPQDPEHMRSGVNIWGKVYDSVHWATTELGTRSKGFVWFFSFLAWYEDVKLNRENVILLLDEPGLSLHGRAQGDLLGYIEKELKPHHQVIYTTHSPFMVDPNHFDRVRIVQDLGIDADKPLPKDQDGTKVLKDVFDATADSLFPLQGALGYDIHQTLFVGPNSLVVEGPADMLFLTGMSSIIEQDGGTGLSEKWTITPVGGAGKVPTFVALLAPQKGLNIATLLDVQSSDRPIIEALYKKKLLQKKKLLTYADFTGGSEADVEDMFDRDFYLNLVNEEYASVLKKPLTLADLNAKQPRVVKTIEAVLEKAPLKSGQFGHFRPARYFSEKLSDLAPKIDADTRERFSKAFEQLNSLLR